MNPSFTKFTPGYMALMLGLGVNPVARNIRDTSHGERLFPHLKTELRKTQSPLVGRWHRGQGMKWYVV